MSCLWGAWWHLPAAFLMAIGGIIGHELAHYVVMYPVAERVKLHISNIWLAELYVESEYKPEYWRHRWADFAGIAPLVSTGVILAGLWWTGGWPDPQTVLGFGFYHGLAWYGFLGGVTDYSRSASLDDESGTEPPAFALMSDGGQQFVEAEQTLLTTLLVALLGAGTGLLYYDVCAGLTSDTGLALAGVSMLLSVAATGILLKRARESKVEFDV